MKSEKEILNSKVIPDISVICDKSGFNEKNCIGVPSLIVKILHPSTACVELKVSLADIF